MTDERVGAGTMAAFTAAGRAENIRRMASERIDVLVIGGGITGVGVALEAASRGASVALIERQDFAAGTSGWSTKLIHGGIRYLPQRQVSLVREALHERATLLKIAPHLVWPLAFVLPIYRETRRPIGVPIPFPGGVGVSLAMEAGLAAYDLLAGQQNVARHRHISSAEALADVPGLRPDGLKGAFVYSDAGTNDTRLTLAVARTAAETGALLANYVEATALTEHDGTVTGVTARDTITGETFAITATFVVNAAGVWSEQVAALGGAESPVAVLPAKGIHLIVDAAKVGITDKAVVLPETPDGRLIFIVPWQGRAVIGTTDSPGGDIERPRADGDEIDYVLSVTNQSIRTPLTRADIISTYAGYRPLVRAKNGAKSAALARTHAVVVAPSGLVTITGGKLTTYRRMAQDTVDRLAEAGLGTRDMGLADGTPLRPSVTNHLPLAGAAGYGHHARTIAADAARRGLDAETAAHLLQNYGSDVGRVLALIDADPLLAHRMAPDLPDIYAEVAFAIREEMALTVEDVLARRTRLSLLDRAHGINVAADVAAMMGDALGWDVAERARQIIAYRTRVEDLHVPEAVGAR